jgi:hypothetical protein
MTNSSPAKNAPSPRKLYAAAVLFCALALALAAPLAMRAQSDDATRSLSRDIFQQLIEINTTDSVGSTTSSRASHGAASARRRVWPKKMSSSSAPTPTQGQHGGAHSWARAVR